MLLRPRAVLAAQLVAVVCVLTPTITAQTEEGVRDAVSKCIGLAAENNEARAKLAKWGEAAWPILREMADRPGSSANHHLMSAIHDLRTREAADLFVDLVEREGHLATSGALDMLWMYATHESEPALLDNERCRSIIVAQASKPTTGWLELENIAEIIEAMEWEEGVPALRDMLDHPNLGVRRAAARALRTLTGEQVEIDEPAVRFPNGDIDESLIELIGAIPREGGSPGHAVGFTTSEAGKHLLIVPRAGTGTVFLDEEFEQVGELRTGTPIDDYLVLPTDEGESQLLAVVDSRWIAPSELRSYSMDGGERWRFGVSGDGVESMTPLYHGGEVYGVVLGIGGKTGVVALDLNGTKLWALPNRYVVYEVRSHPGLHSRVVRCGLGIEIIDARGKRLARDENLAERLGRELLPSLDWDHFMGTGDGELYPSHAQVFPDVEKRAAVVVAGSGNNSVETIARWDEDGETIWHATVPTDVEGLCLIEPPDGQRLFAAVTRDGELYVFDEDGTLRHQRSIVDQIVKLPGSDSRVYVTGMKSGRLGDDTVFTISLLFQTLVYKVNP